MEKSTIHLCPEMHAMAKMMNLARFCHALKCDECGEIQVLKKSCNLKFQKHHVFKIVAINVFFVRDNFCGKIEIEYCLFSAVHLICKKIVMGSK